MWRNELQHRDQAYWKRQCKREEDLVKIFEGIDKSLNDALVTRYQLWLNNMDFFNDNLKSMYYAQNAIGITCSRAS